VKEQRLFVIDWDDTSGDIIAVLNRMPEGTFYYRKKDPFYFFSKSPITDKVIKDWEEQE
jgi:hypothetical protein